MTGQAVPSEIARLQAALRAAACSAPPGDAKDGEWLRTQLDRTEYLDGFGHPSGPVVWVPRALVHDLTLARLATLKDAE